MFHSIEELIVQSKNYDSVAALMIATEIALTGRSREEILQSNGAQFNRNGTIHN